MAKEREWRFVVTRGPSLRGRRGTRIEQGYLHASKELTIRVRLRGPVAYLSVKAKPKGGARSGPTSRDEFEYAIPVADAKKLMRVAQGRVVKRRHLFGRVELDVFEGELRGLVIAEIEVGGRSRRAPAPPVGWQWRDVSQDDRWSNARLAREGLPKGAPRARLG